MRQFTLPEVIGAMEVADATRPGGQRYAIAWEDAFFFGAQGYGFVNELDRRGFDVGGPPPLEVQLTERLTRAPEDATAVVVVASGKFIDTWRAVDGARELASADGRTSGEVARFERLRAGLVDDLRRQGLDHLVAEVDDNLFAVQLDPDLGRADQLVVNEMLELGESIAVFLLDAGDFAAASS